MENYINLIPKDLVYIILYYLDNIKSIKTIININYEDMFKLKYNYNYILIKKLENIQNLIIDWEHLYDTFNINYKEINDIFNHEIKLSNLVFDKLNKIIYGSLILRDYPHFFESITNFEKTYEIELNYMKVYDKIDLIMTLSLIDIKVLNMKYTSKNIFDFFSVDDVNNIVENVMYFIIIYWNDSNLIIIEEIDYLIDKMVDEINCFKINEQHFFNAELGIEYLNYGKFVIKFINIMKEYKKNYKKL